MFTAGERLFLGSVGLVIALLSLRTAPIAFWVLLSGPLLMAWGYVRYGTVLRAFHAYRAREWTTLRTLLGQVVSREWLRAQDRAYFDFLSGVAALVDNDVPSARSHLARVEPRLLRTDNLRCRLACHRADAALRCGDVTSARGHLEEARTLDHDTVIDVWIATLSARAR